MGTLTSTSSDLHERLQAAGVDTIIGVGCASDVCVGTTIREAAMLDYKALFVMDATGTVDDESHNGAIRGLINSAIVDLTMTDTLVAELTSKPA